MDQLKFVVLDEEDLEVIAKDYPKYKPDVENIMKKVTLKEGGYSKVRMEEFHSELSKLYFETRKAIEFFWTEEEKKNSKNDAKKKGGST